MTETIDVQEAAAIILDMHQFHYRAWDKLDSMEKCAKNLKNKKYPEKTVAFHEIEAIRTFFHDDVGPHFQMEEAKVYPFVKALLPPHRRSSIAYMVREHRAIWQQVIVLRELCLSLHEGGESALDKRAAEVGDVALQIVRLTRRHITKENLIYQVIESAM